MAETKELKSLLRKVNEESEKVDLKLNIQKTKIMASSSITSWQIHGETTGTVVDFILGGSKITADGDCSHEIKSCLLLGRKAITSLNNVLKKQRHYLANKGLSRLEKEMATHSSVLAWRIPGTEEPVGLLSVGSQSWTRLTQLSSSSSRSYGFSSSHVWM